MEKVLLFFVVAFIIAALTYAVMEGFASWGKKTKEEEVTELYDYISYFTVFFVITLAGTGLIMLINMVLAEMNEKEPSAIYESGLLFAIMSTVVGILIKLTYMLLKMLKLIWEKSKINKQSTGKRTKREIIDDFIKDYHNRYSGTLDNYDERRIGMASLLILIILNFLEKQYVCAMISCTLMLGAITWYIPHSLDLKNNKKLIPSSYREQCSLALILILSLAYIWAIHTSLEDGCYISRIAGLLVGFVGGVIFMIMKTLKTEKKKTE